MYSLSPLENVTSDYHIGFWITVIVAVFLIYQIIQEPDWIGQVLVIICITTFIGFVSFLDPVVHPNTEVTGEFLGYTPEQQSYRCGKNSTCYTNKMFGEFKVPEGMIVLEINPAYPMPKFVKLYKN